jgi:hypothetical protein
VSAGDRKAPLTTRGNDVNGTVILWEWPHSMHLLSLGYELNDIRLCRPGWSVAAVLTSADVRCEVLQA